jgi:hypothetical protein
MEYRGDIMVAKNVHAPRILIHALLIVLLLFGQAGVQPAQAGILQTIGDFLSLGANTVRELQDAIRIAGGEVRATLETLEQTLSALLDEISETYQDNLNVTLDSLDAATRSKLLELETVMGRVNEKIQEDIQLISDEAKEVINEASLQIRRLSNELREDLQDVIIVGGETAVFVLDRAASNIIVIVAIIMLGIGLLIFVWLLFTRRLSATGMLAVLTLLFMFAYVAVFASLIFIPTVRVFVMTSTGIGLRQQLDKTINAPRILALVPDTIHIGETTELEIWGSQLRPTGEPPAARIASLNVPINAASNDLLVLNVSGVTGPSSSTNVNISYPDGTELSEVVRLIQPTPVPIPPDLTITAFTLNPRSPVVGNNTRAVISVRNTGGTAARDFVVRWRPTPANTSGLTTRIANLEPGATTQVVQNFAYRDAGNFQTVVEVDIFNNVSESNEGNNNASQNITVQPAPPRQARVSVTFTSVTVHDDAEHGAGEMRLDFNVNGERSRFPSSGTQTTNSGRTHTINRTITVTLQEGQNLTVFVNGTEEDSGLTGADDDMGSVSKTYNTASNWGSGSHSERSTCPDGCYTIHYTVTVTPQ